MTDMPGLYASTQDDPLYKIVPDWILEGTVTQIRVPERVECRTCEAPSPSANRLVKIGANPEPGLIVLHPDFYHPRTATGEALRAHELYHVWQREVYPDFEKRFLEAAQATEDAGLDPWENPFEKPAYEFEEKVKDHLRARGYAE